MKSAKKSSLQSSKKKSKQTKNIYKRKLGEMPEGYVFGRPIDYKPEFCELLERHMAEGYSFESFAGVIGSTEETIHQWAKKYSDFSESKKRAFALCRVHWEREGRVGHHLGKNFNATMWVFQMKNRFRKQWGDNVQVTAEVELKDLEGFQVLKPKLPEKKNDEPSGTK